jgi:hypothetical protein
MNKKDYKMIQVSAETHKLLKDYCVQHGFNMSGLIAKLVREQVKKKL